MTPDLLARAGALLYGPRWQTDMARNVGCSVQFVTAILRGERAIPPAKWARVLDLLKARKVDIKAFLKENGG